MSNAAVSNPVSGEKSANGFWLWALAALIVCLAAISTQSLWIDELFMVAKAKQPTLHDWWQTMCREKGSDLQMPFYMIYMWGFVKVFGLGEWALRAANIPWFVAGVALFIPAFPRPTRWAMAVVTLACPFAWYYLDEGRPYAMQLGAGLTVFAALVRLRQIDGPACPAEGWWLVAFFVGLLALCGSSLLGVIGAMAACLSLPFIFSFGQIGRLLRAHWLICLIGCAALAALGVYFIWALQKGAGEPVAGDSGSGTLVSGVARNAAQFLRGRAGATDARDLAFIAYELSGLGGLGPGRLAIRENGLDVFWPYVIQLAPFAALIGWLLFEAVRQVWQRPDRKRWFGVVLAVVAPVVMLLLACGHIGLRAYGRHLTPVLPALLFVMGAGLAAGFSKPSRLGKFLAAAFVLYSVASCLSFRFAARHGKDDYRGAAEMAHAALNQQQIVWWCADGNGAEYYGVPLNPRYGMDPSKAIQVQNVPLDGLARLPAPDQIIMSKADIYDVPGNVGQYIQHNTFVVRATLRAFTVWERKNNAEQGEFH